MNEATSPIGMTSVLWFLAIVALIPVTLWLLKRTPMGSGQTNHMMRTVAILPLSPGQRIVTVEVGQGEERRWLVLGVTPQHISTLHSMEPQDDAAQPNAAHPAASFAQLLNNLRGKNQPTP
jgi:flagellar protein FliO/FliZ